MSAPVPITLPVTFDLTIETMADAFSQMTDDEQAQFFVEVAKRFAKFEYDSSMQAWYIGGHLRNCKCSTEDARQLIRDIADGMENSMHGAEAA